MFKVKQKISKVLLACLTALFAVVLAIGGLFAMPNTTVNAADTEIAFNLGANGSASHNDGSSKTSYTETVDGYTLSITNGTQFYTGARDAKGNSCFKLGSSKIAGSFTLTAPNDITIVVFEVAAYKANTATIDINGTKTTLTTKSNNGQYDVITVDTTTNKTINFKVSSGLRAMVNTITFVIPAAAGACEHNYEVTSTTPATCTEDGSTTEICNLCADEKTTTIPAKGHTYGEGLEITAPTCTTAGEMSYTCTTCNDSKTEATPAKGHTYVDNNCSVCGEPKPAKLTLDFSTTNNRVSQDSNKQIWQQNGITFTNNKGSGNNIIDSSNPVRLYKNSSITIEYPAMTKITFKCAADYLIKTSLSDNDQYTFTVDGNNATVVFKEATDSYTFTLSGNQVRLYSIDVEYQKEPTTQELLNEVGSYMSLSYAYSTDTVETDGIEEEIMLSSKFVIRCGIDASIANIADVESYGIRVSAGAKTEYYNVDTANSWTLDEENNVYYVVINLGDIINNAERLSTEFTVQAYVVYAGVTYTSELSKTFSVASMIDAYNKDNQPVTHLYNYLVSKGLIEGEVA